jgi:outer membrane receptor protein involved in Fe transport
MIAMAALLLIPATTLHAQTTGRLFGQLVDAQGATLPGVTVTVSSPALQGTQTQVSDADGNFRFPSLPPGHYTVKAELASFKTIEQEVDIGLDRTITLNLKMALAGVTETVTVQALSPTVDTTSTTTGVNVTPEMFNRLPMRRDFYGLTTIAPGVTQDMVGPVVYGSSSAENQYIVDGLNTTGVELGDKGKLLNNDFIQEVEVKTGGLPAEYGRMTGGVVNVLTKSGGNQIRGSAFGFAEGGPLQANNSTASERPQTTTQVVDVAHQADAGVELGGFVVKDRLWYFGAYNRVNERDDTTVIRGIASPGAPAVGSVIPLTTNRDLYAVKLTGKLGSGHTLNFNVNGDPSKRTGNIFGIAGPPSTFDGGRKIGGTDLVGRYNGVLGSRFLVQGIAARHQETDEISGAGRDIPLSIDTTVDPNANTGGFGFFQDQKFDRTVVKGDVTAYLGSHDVKIGGDYEHITAVNNNFNGGAGQRIYKLSTLPGGQGTTYYRHRFYVNDRAPGYDRSDPTTWQLALPLTSEPDSANTSFYAQDSWKLGDYFTINGGIRWEGQDVRNRDGESAFKLNQNWSPRVGFIWDVTRNSRSKLYANYGRFYESVPMDINIRSFGGEVQCFCYNFDPDPSNLIPDPTAPGRTALLGGATPVDPDLKGQFIDEWLGGFEYQLQNNIVLGAKYTHRRLGRVIEDFLIPSEGNYFVANPGTGLGSEMGFYDFVHTAPAPKPKRIEDAFEVTAEKRFSNNWQLLASAVFSRLEGNYDGTFQSSTGQLDPNINSAFDYADFLVNADGKLSNDRIAQVKVFGTYEFSQGPMKGFNVGVGTHWYSGLPLNAYGYSRAYQNWEYYLVPRGSVGRGPSDWEADLHFAYPILLGGTRRLNVIADIFNVFDRQAITQFDERYNLISSGVCGGIAEELCHGDGGIVTTGTSLTPAGSSGDPRATSPNPDYLKTGPDSQSVATAFRGFTGQRSLRLGVRFTF